MMTIMRRSSLALASFAVLLVIPLAGCPWLAGPPDDDGPPCDEDLNQCSDDTSKFVEDPSCELTGELELEIGQGEDNFSPLASGELPEIHTGFQGGQHVWMAVRVKNPDLTRPQLKIRTSLSYCDANCDDPASWQIDNVRELVADSTTLTTTTEGWFEASSMLVTIFNWPFGAQRRIEMLVTDPCSRQGLVVAEGT
jgi:hypothetical protein